jgi:hypothetical protein
MLISRVTRNQSPVTQNYGKSFRHAPAYQVGQEHTADNQSDEDGRRGEAQALAGPCNGFAAVR